MSGTLRDSIYKELLIRYRKEKIRNYLYSKEKNLTIEKKQKLEDKVDELWKDNLRNPDLLREICGFVIVQYSDSYDTASFEKLKHETRRCRGNAFKIIDIERVHSEMITNFSFGVSLDKPNGNNIKVSDTTGLFKIVFSDGLFMYYAKWVSGAGKSKSVEGLFAAEKHVWVQYLKMMRKEKKKSSKPKNGIFRIHSTQYGIIYDKLGDLQTTPVVHPSAAILLQDITFYYDNVKIFTRFGMPGVRKALIVGQPGTGKTSLAIKIAKQFSPHKCVVFSTSISDIAAHLQNCAKHNVSTLAILEDAETTLANAQSPLLNFLDGVDQPKNLLGSYIIMTTNHPKRIEPRILKRPGRIDKIIKFGVLNNEYAIACAEIYFDGLLFNEKNNASTDIGKKIREDLCRCVNGMSGAEIKELAQASASFAASEAKDMDVKLIESVKSRMKEELQDISKYVEDESPMTKMTSVGFGTANQSENVFEFKPVEQF